MEAVNLAECLVVKRENLFLLAPRDGRLPAGEEHPLGLWFRDCRFLSVHELVVDGAPPYVLQASDAEGMRAVHYLASGAGTLSMRLERTLEARDRLRETILVHNHRGEGVRSELTLRLAVDFAPMLAVRGLVARVERRPEVSREEGTLRFALLGRDGVLRTTTVTPSGPAETHARSDGAAVLRFGVDVPPAGAGRLELVYAVAEEGGAASTGAGAPAPRPAPAPAERTRVRSDDELFDRVLGRSLADLEMLRSELGGLSYYSAGVPWFATLFGRDSLIAAMQMLAFAPGIAGDTLRLHAGLLGRELDDVRDEEPGKVVHELRVGEPATLGETPFARYYGTADATPLWLCLLCDHADWTGDLELFRELRPQVDAALAWLERHGDLDGDALIEYRRRAPGGLANQGWRDSPGGVPDAAGRPLEPPVALVEVQGYAIRAERGVARLLELDGDGTAAERLRARAEERAAALERLRLPSGDAGRLEDGAYAIGLDGQGRPGSGLTSNQGHLLWAGAVPDAHAPPIRDLLMGERMFSGWGIRTLGEGHAGYNPLGYHTGTVWPHDTALIAAGLRRYGFDADFAVLSEALLEAASRLPDHRMPELFGGFARRGDEAPVPYPVACRPQAWAAGAIPQLLTSGLGLRPDGLTGSLRVVRPRLPRWVDRLELEDLRVAGARVDLRFERDGDRARIADARVDGKLAVVVDAGTG
jgi:glycogen debranching enzyme